jgi:hypothetical protein
VGINYKWVQYNENLKAPRIDKLIDKHRAFRIAAANLNAVSMNSTIDDTSQVTNTIDSSSPQKKAAHYYMFGESPKAA